MVNLYSKKGCVQCRFTARDFDKLGIPYNKIDVEEDEAALYHVKELGYAGLPVVEFGELNFQGFKPEKLKEIANSL